MLKTLITTFFITVYTCVVYSQSYFVLRPDLTEDHAIINANGETFFRTPPGLYFSGNNEKAFAINKWPIYFQKRNYGSPTLYASLSEDGTWTEVEKYSGNQRDKAASFPYTIDASDQYFITVLDTTGTVMWADSCDKIIPLTAHTVFVAFRYHNLLTAYQIIDLRNTTQPLWQNRDFTISAWHQLDNVDWNTIRIVHLGLGTGILYPRSERGFVQPLPNDFLLTISRMPKLERLSLEAKAIDAEQLLDVLVEKETLRILSLKHCGLNKIPPMIRRLESLEELDLSYNNLEDLPKAIFRMQHLKVLNIMGNNLPPAFIPRLQKALPSTTIVYKRR